MNRLCGGWDAESDYECLSRANVAFQMHMGNTTRKCSGDRQDQKTTEWVRLEAAIRGPDPEPSFEPRLAEFLPDSL